VTSLHDGCPASRSGTVYWITGLSGAGKTTVAAALSALLDEVGRAHVRLDGDAMRPIFAEADRYDRQSRLALARRYSGLCKLIADQGLDVVCSTISLFGEIHRWNRANLRHYVEVFLDVDAETRHRRDSKGLYGRVRDGAVTDVAGVDLAVELPESPDLTVCNDGREPPRRIAEAILAAGRRGDAVVPGAAGCPGAAG